MCTKKKPFYITFCPTSFLIFNVEMLNTKKNNNLAEKEILFKNIFTDIFNELSYYYSYITDLQLKEEDNFPSGSQELEMIHSCLTTAAVFWHIFLYTCPF